MKKMINNIPNLITISRMISCLLGAVFFTMGNISVSIGCYAYGAISDAFDGLLARKLNAITDLGKKLDPLSDKLYALSLMLPAIVFGNYLMIVPFILEGIISAINTYADLKYKKTYTEKVGKKKTIVLFPTMILGLFITKFPNLYIIFLPSFVISSNLQAKCIVAYSNQLNEIKNQVKKEGSKKENNIENLSIENKKNITLSNNSVKKNAIYKNKKLVRKKDYNDRY